MFFKTALFFAPSTNVGTRQGAPSPTTPGPLPVAGRAESKQIAIYHFWAKAMVLLNPFSPVMM